jgi:peptidase M23-like protein
MAKSARKMFAAMVFVAVACGARAAPAVAESWTWPVAGSVITPYVNDNSRPYAAGMHRGIDIAAPVGTKVVAAHAGSVTYAGSLGSSGLTVAIATSDGVYLTSYLHLSRISVARGAGVEAGAEVGEVGTTGTRSASEPHLHFGVRRVDDPAFYVDPESLLPLQSPPNRAPVASVPARDPVRAGPAPAPAPAALTVPLGRPLRLPGRAPERPDVPGRLPKAIPGGQPVPVGARAPNLQRSPRAVDSRPPGTAPAAGLVPRPSTSPARSGAAPASERRHGAAAGRGRLRSGLASPRAAGEPAGDWGRLLTIAGLALFAAAIAGRRLMRLCRKLPLRLARLRRQRAQPGARPSGPARTRLAGVSQMS